MSPQPRPNGPPSRHVPAPPPPIARHAGTAASRGAWARHHQPTSVQPRHKHVRPPPAAASMQWTHNRNHRWGRGHSGGGSRRASRGGQQARPRDRAGSPTPRQTASPRRHPDRQPPSPEAVTHGRLAPGRGLKRNASLARVAASSELWAKGRQEEARLGIHALRCFPCCRHVFACHGGDTNKKTFNMVMVIGFLFPIEHPPLE